MTETTDRIKTPHIYVSKSKEGANHFLLTFVMSNISVDITLSPQRFATLLADMKNRLAELELCDHGLPIGDSCPRCMSNLKHPVVVLDALIEMVDQHCQAQSKVPGELESCALSANANALRVLADHGLVDITSEFSRMINANWNHEAMRRHNAASREHNG